MKSARCGDRQASGRDAPKGRRARAAEPWIARSKVFLEEPLTPLSQSLHLRCGVTIPGFLRGGRVCAVAVELPASQLEERVPQGAAPAGVDGPPPPAVVAPTPRVWGEHGFPATSGHRPPPPGQRGGGRSGEDPSCPRSPEPNPGPQSRIHSAFLSGPQFPHLSEGLRRAGVRGGRPCQCKNCKPSGPAMFRSAHEVFPVEGPGTEPGTPSLRLLEARGLSPPAGTALPLHLAGGRQS